MCSGYLGWLYSIERSGIYSFEHDVSTVYCGAYVFRCYRVYLTRINTDFCGFYFEVPVFDKSNS